ncbi:RNA polymerase sigma factor [Acetivibrio mesophilus]|uniref:RNA polymerase sigma factor n=1 Tax=Acetivibrio mesophilus TaxID=2487273 RepID=A0A4Q0I492_9FIRM|nr:RNA polymerase sigma factor [Acetivibrio mesophilus]RXE58597.1 RNA polymerase sigma factor [Acetivibrio mesophilus]
MKKEFDEIYRLYVNDVYRFLISITGDEKIAEELTQETFYRALRGIDKFKGNCKMSVWLCQIAKNLYYSYSKKEKANYKQELNETLHTDTEIDERVITSQNNISLHKILHSIEEPYKEVFSLKVFAELSYRQISEIFGKSEAWARVTYYRAKEKIKSLYMESEGL